MIARTITLLLDFDFRNALDAVYIKIVRTEEECRQQTRWIWQGALGVLIFWAGLTVLLTGSISLKRLLDPASFLFKEPFFLAEKDPERNLRQLRDEFKLDRFKDNPIALGKWVHEQWGHNSPKEPTNFGNFDALHVLRRAEKGETFLCGESAYTLMQCLVSVGIPARVVILQDKNKNGHVVTEYLDEDNIWGVLDPDLGVYYTAGGQIMSAIGLHRAVLDNKLDSIKVVNFYSQEVENPNKAKYFDRYWKIALRMRNNFTVKYPWWHPRQFVFFDSLEWRDKECGDSPMFFSEAGNYYQYWPNSLTDYYVPFFTALEASGKARWPWSQEVRIKKIPPGYLEYSLDKYPQFK